MNFHQQKAQRTEYMCLSRIFLDDSTQVPGVYGLWGSVIPARIAYLVYGKRDMVEVRRTLVRISAARVAAIRPWIPEVSGRSFFLAEIAFPAYMVVSSVF